MFLTTRSTREATCCRKITVRDKLLLMAQPAGSATSASDDYTMLFVRRVLIGQLFIDLGFQISDLVDAIAKSKTQMGRAGVQ
jgi:hypothetical protein